MKLHLVRKMCLLIDISILNIANTWDGPPYT